jgi:ribosome-binding factor A
MSHRLKKINELIRQELGKIILSEEELESGILATVMAAETSEDLRHANITISVFPTQKGNLVLKRLEAHIFALQQALNKKLKFHPVPKIRFVLDNTESESQEVETLIVKLKTNGNEN